MESGDTEDYGVPEFQKSMQILGFTCLRSLRYVIIRLLFLHNLGGYNIGSSWRKREQLFPSNQQMADFGFLWK